MINDKLITGISSPLGMAVLPVPTGKFPAGTIFLCAGSAPIVDSNGETITDRARAAEQAYALTRMEQSLARLTPEVVQYLKKLPVIQLYLSTQWISMLRVIFS